MAVEKEQVELSQNPLPGFVSTKRLSLVRGANGMWTLKGRIRVEITLNDGRMIWGMKPFAISGLSQEGRRPRREG